MVYVFGAEIIQALTFASGSSSEDTVAIKDE